MIRRRRIVNSAATHRYIDAWEKAAQHPNLFVCTVCHAVAPNVYEIHACECRNPVMPIACAEVVRVGDKDIIEVIRRIDELRSTVDA